MTHSWKTPLPALATVCLVAGLAAGLAQPALAGAWSNSAAYNGGAFVQNRTSNYSMRDQYGNLTMVNGRLTPSIYSAQSGGGSQYANSYAGGVGTGGAGTVGEAYAIGNQLNVTVVGTHNTTIISSDQTNNGNQSATAALNAK